MSFASVLDSYCSNLGCTNAVVAERCGVSASSLSRYRNGSRVPTNLGTVRDIARGIADLSKEGELGAVLAEANVEAALKEAWEGPQAAGETFSARVDRLMTALDIQNSMVARLAHVDPSYLSRIRSGQRTPLNREHMVDILANVAANRCVRLGETERLASFIPGIADLVVEDRSASDPETLIADDIAQWLLGDVVTQTDLVELERLFEWMDHFDFEANSKRLSQFVEMPEMDLEPRARFCYSIEGMREAELEFLDIAAYSCSQNVCVTSDMPMFEGVAGDNYPSQLVGGVERIVCRGGFVKVIHNVERPLLELVSLMRDWVPLYMTGRVVPLHLRGLSNRLFCHVNYVCDSCALSAEAVVGHLAEGRHYISLLPEDIEYYHKKMEFILERTAHVVDIYLETRPGDLERYEAFEKEIARRGLHREVCKGKYENIRVLSVPGECAVVSHVASPRAHFVVRHPKVRYAISLMS